MFSHTRTAAACLAAAVMGAGCVKDHTAPQLDAQAGLNAWVVQTYQDPQVHAAVVAQGALFPHHFVAGSAQLNELGARDVGILAAHFSRNAGALHVRRGDADRRLYAARLATIRDALADAGVPRESISIDDDLPGGEGVRAERALHVLKQDTKPLKSATSTRSISEGGESTGSSQGAQP